MNHKRGFLAFIVAFVFMFFFGFVWHGLLMKPMYNATGALWRPEPIFPVLILGHAIVAFAFTGLYVSKVGVNCAGVGFGYGLVIGILACGINIIRFAVEPLTTNILLMWFAADLICFAIMGALVGAIYKPLSTNTIV
ncbi:MAG TPA: hypothetical protein VKS98_05265 [Chthoniobacterales bacterium]|nr:hypothetical protein [Chthoniobacterales bacterium]